MKLARPKRAKQARQVTEHLGSHVIAFELLRAAHDFGELNSALIQPFMHNRDERLPSLYGSRGAFTRLVRWRSLNRIAKTPGAAKM
jgi:hypothetical protein